MKIIYYIILFFMGLSTAHAGLCSPKTPSTGGPCEYSQYKGHATIISITKIGEATRDTAHEKYEVEFSFTPDQYFQGIVARTEVKKYVLLLDNSSYPGPKFLEKYEIKEEKIFECFMKVITKGTCTPIIFEFPMIRLDDYFEDIK
jgi:hypothetical protein